MSLISFLNQPAVREGFRSVVTKPPFKSNMPLLAPPRTTNYGILGSAFDYLLRFYLERLNPVAKTSEWVAEECVKALRQEAHPSHELAQRFLDDARQHYQTYIHTGILKDDLVSSALRLAYIDVVYRAGS